MLIVFDNCDLLLSSSEKAKFSDLLDYLLSNCNYIKILLATRCPVGGMIGDCIEKIYNLTHLKEEESKNLLLLRAPRCIPENEIQELLQLDGRNQQNFSKHVIFELFGGHPQVI